MQYSAYVLSCNTLLVAWQHKLVECLAVLALTTEITPLFINT